MMDGVLAMVHADSLSILSICGIGLQAEKCENSDQINIIKDLWKDMLIRRFKH